jgi:hypothetical protein
MRYLLVAGILPLIRISTDDDASQSAIIIKFNIINPTTDPVTA